MQQTVNRPISLNMNPGGAGNVASCLHPIGIKNLKVVYALQGGIPLQGPLAYPAGDALLRSW